MTRRIPEIVVAAILDDWHAGMIAMDIAERHGVSEKTVNRHTLKAGLREMNRSQARTRSTHACDPCGKRCRTEESTCRTCDALEKETRDIALTGGRWVPRDGILRWEADPELTLAHVQAAHSAFNQGLRSAAIEEGERAYQRLARRRRAQPVITRAATLEESAGQIVAELQRREGRAA